MRKLAAVAVLLSASAFAAAPGVSLDVPTPYLPSTQVAVDEMLRIAGTGPDDLVVDLGSGDGRVVIAAGARVAGGYLPAFDAKLTGDRIAFVLVDDGTSHRFEGTVQGTLSMEGTVRSGPGRNRAMGSWRATRVVGLPDEG